jgi:predicted ATPase
MTMGRQIDKITLRGFKSIKDLEDFPLRSLNILIGANGAGKSNFVSFFTFLHEAVEGRLGLYVTKKGGADNHLFMGPKVTDQIYAHLHFAENGCLSCYRRFLLAVQRSQLQIGLLQCTYGHNRLLTTSS